MSDVIGVSCSSKNVAFDLVRDLLVAAGFNDLRPLHKGPHMLHPYKTELIGGPGAFALACPHPAPFVGVVLLCKPLREWVA